MPDDDLPQYRPQLCRISVKGTASVASIGSFLRAAYPVDNELAPALQVAMNALIDHD